VAERVRAGDIAEESATICRNGGCIFPAVKLPRLLFSRPLRGSQGPLLLALGAVAPSTTFPLIFRGRFPEGRDNRSRFNCLPRASARRRAECRLGHVRHIQLTFASPVLSQP
jgi:hypothetical protein